MSEAVVVDGTVRRPAGPWTPAVHALLRHYERVGFDGAPRALGIDEEGREMVSYVAGEIADTVDDDALFALGGLVRAMHDAQKGFERPADAAWRRSPGAPTGDEVICHHDTLGPNFVFRDGRPVALIDWEFAAPGLRLTDVALTAAWWAPLRPRREAPEVARRVRIVADGYGLDAEGRRSLLDAIPAAVAGAYETQRVWAEVERDPRFVAMWESGGARGLLSALEAFHEYRPEIERCLR